MGFSVKTNSIGFYHLSKLHMISFLVLYKLLALKESTRAKTLLSLAALLVGMTLFTVNDVAFSFVGTIIALVVILMVATYQTLTQTTHKINGTQPGHCIGLPQFIIYFTTPLVI
jgi:hypothetical protein